MGAKMTINAQNRLLPDWFSRFRLRQTVLPRFQRFEAWGHANVTPTPRKINSFSLGERIQEHRMIRSFYISMFRIRSVAISRDLIANTYRLGSKITKYEAVK